MDLIKSIHIKNFRSCRDLNIQDCKNLNVLAGLNNVGKSNVLRALSLFFNDEVEPGTPLDMGRDFGGPQKTKQEIEITVRFNLPEYFGDNQRSGPLIDRTGRDFEIKGKWDSDDPNASYTFIDGEVEDSDAGRIVDLVFFRYIPAHRDPSALIQEAEEDIRKEIMRRFKTSQARKEEAEKTLKASLLEELSDVARDYISPVSESLAAQIKDVEDVVIDIPKDLANLVVISGYYMEHSGGQEVDTPLQGSGVQSSLLFELLLLSDTSFSKYFGTKQAVVWAVEEPECFLHTQLEVDVASLFWSSSTDSDYRLQIFSSTHSDIFMQYSDQGFMLDKDESSTNVETETGIDFVKKSAKKGISRLNQVLLWKRAEPLLLVEGKTDKRYIKKTFEISDMEMNFEIYDLEELTQGEKSGGSSNVKKIIRNEGHILRARPDRAPLVALFDWDESEDSISNLSDRMSKFHNTSTAIIVEDGELNPDLHESFKGIERSLSTRIIEMAEDRDIITLSEIRVSGVLQPADRGEYGRSKSDICDLFIEEADERDIEYLSDIASKVKEAMPEQ